MAEELTLDGPGAEFAAAADLNRARLQAQRADASPPPEALAAAAAEEEQLLAEEEAEQDARRLLARARRAAGTRGGADESAASLASELTSAAEELIEVITFFVEIETIVVPLALFAKWTLQFWGGNLGILPSVIGPAVKWLDKVAEAASAGTKTATKVGSTGLTQATGQAAGASGGGGLQAAAQQLSGGGDEGVKPISIGLIFLTTLLWIVLSVFLLVNFIVFAAVPLLLAGGAAGIFVGVCSALGDLCTSETFSSIIEAFSSIF